MEKAQKIIVILLVIAIIFSVGAIILNFSMLNLGSGFNLPTKYVIVNKETTRNPTQIGGVQIEVNHE